MFADQNEKCKIDVSDNTSNKNLITLLTRNNIHHTFYMWQTIWIKTQCC